ncbi:MAG: sigma-70 family RNA polymerase sigma factor [Methylobacterium mesophilicum]|nr:sigma-70 family RNA polymerase sigma factor [Methylobacterium mesophilicum]
MMSVAAYHARGVSRRLGLEPSERVDVEQEILLTFIERRRFFDPDRGAWSTFLNAIVGGIAGEIAMGLRTRWRREGPVLPIAAPEKDPDDDDVVRPQPAAAEVASPEPAIVFALSLQRFVDSLPPHLAIVAELALEEEGDTGEALRRSGLSSSEFFRRLREVRMRLRCFDLVRFPRPAAGNFGSQSEAA